MQLSIRLPSSPGTARLFRIKFATAKAADTAYPFGDWLACTPHFKVLSNDPCKSASLIPSVKNLR